MQVLANTKKYVISKIAQLFHQLKCSFFSLQQLLLPLLQQYFPFQLPLVAYGGLVQASGGQAWSLGLLLAPDSLCGASPGPLAVCGGLVLAPGDFWGLL